jgi:hypothetical protein
MIRKVLFPVDFSPSCTAMAAYVHRAAALCGARVSLVHVCDLASHMDSSSMRDPAMK